MTYCMDLQSHSLSPMPVRHLQEISPCPLVVSIPACRYDPSQSVLHNDLCELLNVCIPSPSSTHSGSTKGTTKGCPTPPSARTPIAQPSNTINASPEAPRGIPACRYDLVIVCHMDLIISQGSPPSPPLRIPPSVRS